MITLDKNAALLIPVDGPEVRLKGSPTLAQAQKVVGGYVESLAFERDGTAAQALFNEEGLLWNMQTNVQASLVVGRPLVGPVIILTGKRRWT